MWQEAYQYRSFEHFKRETFPIIAAIAEKIDGPIRMADISCGPAVLDGILLTKLGERVKEVHLLDIDQGFLDIAKGHLSDLRPDVLTHVFDVNTPDEYPALADLNLLVSTNAIFHATGEALPKLYRWCHSALVEDGIFLNHQAFGQFSPGFDQELMKYCECLHAKRVLDDLDTELLRRSSLDAKSPGEGGDTSRFGSYAGLGLTVFQHLGFLRAAGFVADEIWRKGTSAMVMAVKKDI